MHPGLTYNVARRRSPLEVLKRLAVENGATIVLDREAFSLINRSINQFRDEDCRLPTSTTVVHEKASKQAV